jgi:hypothetical protein
MTLHLYWFVEAGRLACAWRPVDHDVAESDTVARRRSA